MPFENVWHDFHPHCTFLIKQSKSSVTDIMCELHSYQNGAENKVVKMKVAEIMAMVSGLLLHCLMLSVYMSVFNVPKRLRLIHPVSCLMQWTKLRVHTVTVVSFFLSK